MSATIYFLDVEEVSATFIALGFPAWLVFPLGFVQILGVIMLIIKFDRSLTEWAYAGIFFNLSLAIGAHVAIRDGESISAVFGLTMMLLSYFTWKQIRRRSFQ